jgi:hypothetical protein
LAPKLTPPVSAADNGLALAQTGSEAPAAMLGAALVNVATRVSAGVLSWVDWQPARASKAVPITAVNSFVVILILLR